MDEFSRSEVDRLGQALREGDLDVHVITRLEEYRRSFQHAYAHVLDVVRNKLHMEVTGRPSKSTSSIVEKLRRETTRLSQMQDIAGCRVVVPDVPAQNKAVYALEVFLGSPGHIDRRERPSHGYRAVHIVPRIDGRSVEIQVRTVFQHMWAEISERMADSIDPAIKYGGGGGPARLTLDRLSSAIAVFEQNEAARADVLEQTRRYKQSGRKDGKMGAWIKRAEQDYKAARRQIHAALRSIKSVLGVDK